MSLSHLCSLCKFQQAEFGCRCNGEIILLGECCALGHYRDTSRHHQSLEFSFALELLTNSEKELTFLDHSMNCIDIQKQLFIYKANLCKFRNDVQDFKEEATEAIAQVSDSVISQLDSIENNIKQQISAINNHLNTLDDTGNKLIQKFKAKGIEGLLPFCPSTLVIHRKEILNAIMHMINLGASTENRFNEDMKKLAKQLENKITTISNLEKQLIKFKREVCDLKLSLNAITFEAEKKNKLNESLELQLISQRETSQMLASELQSHQATITRLMDENSTLKSQLNSINSSTLESDKIAVKLEPETEIKQCQMSYRCKVCMWENLDSSSLTFGMEESNSCNGDSPCKAGSTSEEDYKLKIIDNELSSLVISERDKEISTLNNFLITKQEEIEKLKASLDKTKSDGLKHKQEFKDYYSMEHKNLSSPILRNKHYSKYSSTRYIYKPGGNFIYQFDTYSKKTMIHNLSSTIDRSFNATSSCVLKNGDVFIAGFNNPISSDVYLFQLGSLECVKLTNMSVGRYGICLYNHKDSIYAFGGKDESDSLSTAEKYSLRNNSWSFLPNMKTARCSACCVGREDKIYLIAGGVKTIEIFDIIREEFVLARIQLKSLLVVSLIYDDRIYILEDDGYKVLDLDLTLIQEKQTNWNQANISINNTILHRNSFIFFNYKSMNIEKFKLPIEEETHSEQESLSEEFKDDLSYIYLPIANTKILSQYDLKSKSLQKINLSTQIDRNFNNTSTCLISNGDVFITGFSSPISGEAYIYRPESKTVVKLPDMPSPRCLVALICVEDHVYAFGGETESGMTRTAERFDICKAEWEILPDMNHERSSSACINVDERIYVIAGGTTSIEDFSLFSLHFTLTSTNTECLDVIGILQGQEIYILGENTLQILNKSTETIHLLQESWNLNGYSINNIINRQDYALFYNLEISNIEKFCFESLRRKVVIINK